ncbi:hypothetical protein NUU61_007969 [Penicillium alfredii]|uniref:Uncharacterized protein n=1 Tax=Penicillium alfredii TaxID=1506179 RepID=A0A9W9ERH4_9EURO|nr:uncharacterized protein NUU61_007969 [Penicillium alfredii]KAJ5086662.1 hypothetical protein NUU61_007969 [Penicillium alfredii]
MAEYWKSAIFIRDTPFEKSQHEASAKHQSSLKRFLRDIHKGNEIQQKEAQRAKSEVERLRQTVAGGSSAADKTGGDVVSQKRTTVPAPKPAERTASIEDRKKQMAQLAEMGIAIPQKYRADMALAGDWQTMSETKIESQDAEDMKASTESVGVRKRKHEGGDEDVEHALGPLVSKGWGSTTKVYPGAQDDADLDALLVSTKDIKKTKTSTPAAEPEDQKQEPVIAAKKEDEAAGPGAPETEQSTDAKTEESGETPAPPVAEKPEIDEPAPEVVFKKRKPKVMKK